MKEDRRREYLAFEWPVDFTPSLFRGGGLFTAGLLIYIHDVESEGRQSEDTLQSLAVAAKGRLILPGLGSGAAECYKSFASTIEVISHNELLQPSS